ncbi:3-methylmercaptopropionyl-CoA dehydrogenase (DmdC) [hydrothermal vent metagenome]|uniref:3-methylmercaptopropionyl-CoA dehydrogenase (DmdC) n=1 Tax=hydrothermal vent metagenome TaxID=652676 RepID=A0A3B0R529_9ZZZZ
MSYQAPVRDILFTLEHICQIQTLAATKQYADLSPDLTQAIMGEAAKFTTQELASINRAGDQAGSTLADGVVTTAPGFKQAYAQFVEGGWQGLSFPEPDGGMGLPNALGVAFMDMLQAANMAFGLGPMLTMGAIEVLIQAGTPEQKQTWLPKLITGEWSASMNLTEPQAGSDVGALRTSAKARADGSFVLKGQKIFITWGEHDCAQNIVHLVLARTENSPAGTKGLSLFLVPKYLDDGAGNFTVRNDVFAIGLEHKLGIHGSPTCTMEYGGSTGAVGWLIGEEMRGMAMMFIMMNSARLNVGAQGVGIAERAWQQAYFYATERKQGKAADVDEIPAAIIHHPDVRRMLLDGKAKIAAARAIIYACGMAADLAEASGDAKIRARAKRREDLLTPLAKSFGTDIGVEVASMNVQVHGGMGFIEETGAAQHYRDARITPIYEGTNGIQAIDLAGRKLSMQGGLLFSEMIAEMRETVIACNEQKSPVFARIANQLERAVTTLQTTATWMADPARDRKDALSGATAFQTLCAHSIGGHYLAIGALAAAKLIRAKTGDGAYYQSRIELADYFASTYLAAVPALAEQVQVGADVIFAISIEGLI